MKLLLKKFCIKYAQLAAVGIVLFISQNVYSQQYNFRKFELADGLPATFVYRVVQDTQSYLWFATDNGVSRYDGTTFKNFTSQNGFPDYGAFHIEKDSRGKIWFLPFNGKICYFENGSFKIPNLPLITQADISWFAEDRKGNYWFSSKEKDGNVFRYDQKEIHTYKVGSPVFTFCELPDGKLIVYGLGMFFTIDPVSGKILKFPLHNKILFARFLKLKDRSVLISTSEGIYKVDSSLQPKLIYPFLKNVFYGEAVSMYEEDNGDIWIGTQDGAWCFQKGELDVEKAQRFLPGTPITSILKDHEKNYWFTSRRGVFNFRSKSTITYTTRDGLNVNEVSYVAPANDGVYIFLANGFIYFLSRDGKLENLEYGAENFQPLELDRIYVRPDGKIRVLTGKFELLLDGKSPQFITTDNSNLWFSHGNSEWYLNEKGIGSITAGIKKHITYTTAIINYSNRNLICVDREGKVWLGTKYGLYIMEGKLTVEKKKENPLFGKPIVDMKRDLNGNIWVATKGNGIYTVLNDSVINYTINDGLLTDYCNSLMIDGDNHIWISGNYGLNKLVLDKNERISSIKVFNKSNSLISNEVKSAYKEGNMVYVSTMNGLTVLDETKIKASDIPPPVYITRMVIGNKDTSVQNHYELDYGFGSMQINYMGVSFIPGNVSYRYKMFPMDTGWNYTSLPSLEYSSLAPGDYRFEVSALNADGIWSKAPASVQFHINTPYWQSWWFRSFIFLSGALAMLLIFYLRLKASKNKSVLNRKLLEAELRALRAQMNPHFIFNALNAIQDFVLKNDKENANMYLSKFATLIRVIMENSKKPFISLNDEIKFLNLYLEIETVRFNHKFSYSFDIDPDIDQDKTKIPSMILQPYIENSIRHGLAAKTGKGKLLVKISAVNSQLKCIIEDDGIGRTVSISSNKALEGKHVSRGMETTSERLRLLNKSSDLNMNVELIDLEDGNGNPRGTKVLLTFPAESEF